MEEDCLLGIASLPDEINLQILGHLTARELTRMQLISTRFRKLARDDSLWIQKINKQMWTDMLTDDNTKPYFILYKDRVASRKVIYELWQTIMEFLPRISRNSLLPPATGTINLRSAIEPSCHLNYTDCLYLPTL